MTRCCEGMTMTYCPIDPLAKKASRGQPFSMRYVRTKAVAEIGPEARAVADEGIRRRRGRIAHPAFGQDTLSADHAVIRDRASRSAPSRAPGPASGSILPACRRRRIRSVTWRMPSGPNNSWPREAQHVRRLAAGGIEDQLRENQVIAVVIIPGAAGRRLELGSFREGRHVGLHEFHPVDRLEAPRRAKPASELPRFNPAVWRSN